MLYDNIPNKQWITVICHNMLIGCIKRQELYNNKL